FFTSNATGSGQIAAINVQDGSINTAQNPVVRGQYITLYGTGLGPLPGAPPDGSLPGGVVSGTTNPQVLIGATSKGFIPDANIQYSGLAPTLVGVWQLNILIPSDATTGSSVPVKVFVN